MFKVISSKTIKPQEANIQLDETCNAEALQGIVKSFNFSRHYSEETENFKAKNMVMDLMKQAGYFTGAYPGCFHSIESEWVHERIGPIIAGGTHFDTVKNCPGADDNTSGIAVLVCAARFLNKNKDRLKATPRFYFFNREEDGLLGSSKYVKRITESNGFTIPDEVHIMEMVGYTSENQSTPQGFPSLGNKGDFLGIVGNGIAERTIQKVGSFVPELHSQGIDIPLELTPMVSDVLRSDHAPFWMAGISATMWTDTSNFRNPNYHEPTDTYDTLDYEFMERVVKAFISLYL